jgi:predicted ATPase
MADETAPITTLAVAGYRSLRDVRIPLSQLTVITGGNGSGKSNLYRAVRLLGDVAQGRALSALARDGGFPSALWAGPEAFSQAMRRGEVEVTGTVRKHPVALKLGFSSAGYGYAIDLGLPPSSPAGFRHDPEIKAEAVWTGPTLGRANTLALRNKGLVEVRGEDGGLRVAHRTLAAYDSMLTHAADPRDGLDLLLLREELRRWRFYDQLRTDRDAPARRPQVGTFTPILSSEGDDLAAAVQTILAIGDAAAFARLIDDAFPGARVEVESADGVFELSMHQHGLLRPLSAAELSDGTLRYLMLTTALLTPRPPTLLVLNEPETSLHPDLLRPLANLICEASVRSQVLVVTHAQALVDALDAPTITLRKELSETLVDADPTPRWTWPSR